MSGVPLPLRRRVALALTALGFVLSALLAGATAWVTEDYEYVLATEILHGQADDYGLRLSNGLPAQLPKTHRLSGYTAAEVPPHVAGFPPGVREDPANDSMHVGVFDTSAGRLYFTVDLSDIETLEAHLAWALAGMVAFGTLLAGLLAWHLAGASLKPLGRLAEAVDALPVEPRITGLRASASDDELGRLAAAIDDYQRRLCDADARQQAFLADASHELRTPIAVVQGVTEVMLDDAEDGDPRRMERLRRLDRGVREMTDLVEMLLAEARRRPLHPETLDAGGFLRDVAGSLQPAGGVAGVAIDASGTLHVDRPGATLLLRHAIERLGWPASGLPLTLAFAGDRLQAAVTPIAGVPQPASRSDGGGIGALAQRLADRLGWEVEETVPGRIAFVLPPASSAPTPPTG